MTSEYMTCQLMSWNQLTANKWHLSKWPASECLRVKAQDWCCGLLRKCLPPSNHVFHFLPMWQVLYASNLFLGECWEKSGWSTCLQSAPTHPPISPTNSHNPNYTSMGVVFHRYCSESDMSLLCCVLTNHTLVFVRQVKNLHKPPVWTFKGTS